MKQNETKQNKMKQIKTNQKQKQKMTDLFTHHYSKNFLLASGGSLKK